MATPFGRYDAGAFHRWVMGGGHRELWSLPVPAPVLDLGTFAGGLEVRGLGGGQQTRSLVFEGGGGQEWRFRSIDKDAARTLDPELRRTLAAKVVQDQIAHLFPLSAAVVDRLLDAAGVLHPRPTLVVLPDDPRLGEHRQEFRGMLGWMEVRPDEGEDGEEGFAGSERVVGSERLLERLEEDPRNRIDAVAYLRARLLDALVGDWDRHPDQWRWAGFERGGVLAFAPVPRDRDWALSKLDGLVASVAWIPWPNYVGFDRDYPSPFRLMWSGRALDRRLLSGLDRNAWERASEDLRARLTDEVIAHAVAALPESYPAEVRTELDAALRQRRDELGRFASRFYAHLAGWVDVHVTDEDEVALAHWLEGGRLALGVRLADADGAPPLLDRVFEPDETHEVRLYLHGGDDRVVVSGSVPSGITLRVLGGGGDDTVEDRSSAGGTLHVHDDRGDDTVRGDRVRVDRSSWEDPVDPEENTHRAGHRDWGSRTLALPAIRYDSDLGLFAGATVERVGYGFRHHPFRTRFAATLASATGTDQIDLAVTADVPFPDRRNVRVRGRARVFGTEFHRFYGFGNGTTIEPGVSERVYAAPRRILSVDAALAWLPREHWSVSLEAGLRGHHPHRQAGTLVEETAPYGSGEFEEIVTGLHVRLDTRDDAVAPRRGVLVHAGAEVAPEALDVESSYGAFVGRVQAHWWAGDDVLLRPALALRAGGRALWGAYPYHAAAYVGGPETLRGFRQERFAGRRSLFAGAEVRAFLTEFVFVLPGDLGMLLLADAGRVFHDADTSSAWHRSWGGGAWVSFLDAYAASVSLARGRDDTLVYVTLGFPF
jgi:hypothetical protein